MKPRSEGVPHGKHPAAKQKARRDPRDTARVVRSPERRGDLPPDIPDLSLGTVYRNLALFREEGKAMSVATVAGQERFDGRTHPHAHFICEKCGRVDDVDAVLPETLVTGEMPGEVRSWALTFYGICRCCAADDHKNNKENKEKN